MTPASSPRARSRPWFQRVVLVLGMGIVGTSVGVALVAGYVGIRFGQIGRVDNIDLQSTTTGEPANYLIVGTDSRAGLDASDPDAGSFLGDAGCNCTDTIMVVRVDPNEGTASIMSFPRDLYLPIAGTGKTARINTAHGQGVQVLINTIEENFDIPINHYAEIDFVGFEELVDAVGGVPMWFDSPVRDSHTGLSIPGAKCQVLDGQTARRFVRSRYLQYQDAKGRWTTDGTADLGRITRQQIFIRRAIAKAVSKGLTNPVTLNALVGAGVSSVQLDAGLSAGDLLGLGKKFARFNSEDLEGFAIPSYPKTTSGGAMVEIPDMREAEPYLNIFRGLPIGTVTPGAIDVTVLNGSGVTGRAADAAGALQKVGFTITDIDTYSRSDVGRTTVRFGAGGEAIARRVADHISGGAALVPDPNGTAGAVVVVIGTDFTTVHDQPAPEGSADAGRTTTSTIAGSPAAGSPGTASPTTTVAGYATGEPPVGVRC
jgi:LCP family protein required for cell wall assembly